MLGAFRVRCSHVIPTATSPAPRPPSPATPADLLRSRRYLALLAIAAALGVLVSVAAYWFLKAIAELNDWAFIDLPNWLGFDRPPLWWPVVPLGVAGLLVGLVVHSMPGR